MSTLAVLQTATTTWNLDPTHSVAEFKVKRMMICNVEGHFGTVTGVLTLDETDRTNSSVEASIEMASSIRAMPSAIHILRARTSFTWRSFRRCR